MEWDFDSNFWLGVGVATAAATALATTISLLVALWWRRVDSHGPEWITFNERSEWFTSELTTLRNSPSATGSIANSGAGTAYRVRMVGIGCRFSLKGETQLSGDVGGSASERGDLVPALAPGERLFFTAWCEPSRWDKALVAISWREPSPWRRRHSRRIELRTLKEIAERPQYLEYREDGRGGIGYVPIEEPAGEVLLEQFQEQLPLPAKRPLWKTRLRRQMKKT